MVINNWRPSGCNSLEALTAQVNPMRLRVEELLHLSHQYLPGGKFDLGIGDLHIDRVGLASWRTLDEKEVG
jgi:hypothetical protein